VEHSGDDPGDVRADDPADEDPDGDDDEVANDADEAADAVLAAHEASGHHDMEDEEDEVVDRRSVMCRSSRYVRCPNTNTLHGLDSQGHCNKREQCLHSLFPCYDFTIQTKPRC
jgi:hypothetical protein